MSVALSQPHSIFQDFPTSSHLRANSDFRNTILRLFRINTLLLAPVVSLFVVLVFGSLPQAASVLVKLCLDSADIVEHFFHKISH